MPGDVVFVSTDTITVAIDYYYDGGAARIGLTNPFRDDPDGAWTLMHNAMAGGTRAWLVAWMDAGLSAVYSDALRDHCRSLEHHHLDCIRVDLYGSVLRDAELAWHVPDPANPSRSPRLQQSRGGPGPGIRPFQRPARSGDTQRRGAERSALVRGAGATVPDFRTEEEGPVERKPCFRSVAPGLTHAQAGTTLRLANLEPHIVTRLPFSDLSTPGLVSPGRRCRVHRTGDRPSRHRLGGLLHRRTGLPRLLRRRQGGYAGRRPV